MRIIEYKGHSIKNRGRGANDWFIVHSTRVRWGTIEQCKADVDYIVAYGDMPPREKGSWH